MSDEEHAEALRINKEDISFYEQANEVWCPHYDMGSRTETDPRESTAYKAVQEMYSVKEIDKEEMLLLSEQILNERK